MYKSVMVIDDSQVDLYISKRMMTKYGFAERIITMDSAEDALEYLQSNAENEKELPNIIFLDINMPHMNGFEFLEAYENLPENVKSRWIIVMLSSSSSIEDRETAAGNKYVKQYLSKPLSQGILEELSFNMTEGFELYNPLKANPNLSA